MVTRQYNFTVGPETSTQPDVGTPASDDDLINRGYADARYAQGKSAAASIAAIKAIGTSDRRNGDLVIDVSTYNLYCFQSASSATNDDDFVLQPDAGSGRWLKFGKSALKAAQFDDISPNTTKGDILGHDGTNNIRVPVGSDGLALIADSTTSSGLRYSSASSGSGEVNYVDNADAEANTTGWATYADAAGSTPVDGTGGSPTVTWTRQDSVVLRGNQSFKLTKDAANRQGEGVSYDFSIKEQDVSKKLKIQFDFKTNEDAAYASGDLTVYIYDVTNSTLITPVDTNIIDGQNIYQTSFNSTTSTSYRLIFHIATTNASAWDAYIDNVIVGPGMTSQGAAIGEGQNVDIDGTDFTNDTGLSIDGELTWKRVGSDIHITFSLETNGTGTDSGALTFDLATAIGQNITFVSGGYGTGYFGFFNSTNADRFTLTARFIADGTGSLQFSQNEGTVGVGIAGTGFGAVTGDRAIVQISAILPVVEYQGSGIVPMLSEDNLQGWTTFTGSGTWTTNTTYTTAAYKRKGNDAYIYYRIDLTGSPNSTNLSVNMPSNLTIDSNEMLGSKAGSAAIEGNGVVTDATGSDYQIMPFWLDSTTVRLRLFNSSGTHTTLSNITDTVPFTFTSGDFVEVIFKVPVVEFSGSQNSLVGYSEASSDNLGLVKKAKVQTKILSSGNSTGGTLTDLTFNSLVIGQLYYVTFQASIRLDSPSSATELLKMKINHNGSNLTGCNYQADSGPSDRQAEIGYVSAYFTAAASTVTFEVEDLAGSSFLIEATSGTVQNMTKSTIRECIDMVETTDFT